MTNAGMRSSVLGAIAACLLLVATVVPVQAVTTITVAYRAAEGPWLQWLQTEFNRRQADVRVEILPGLGGWGTVEVLATWWVGGVFPDVFFGTGGDVQNYILKGWTADLSGLIERDSRELDIRDFFPGSIDVWKFDGKTHGLPIGISGQTILYNRNLLAEAGLPEPPNDWATRNWSWNDMITYGQKMTRRDSAGLVTRFGATLRGRHNDLGWVFGGEQFTPESYTAAGTWGSALFSPENIRAYEAALDAMYATRVVPDPSGGAQWATGSAGSLLDGRLAMSWTGWWGLTPLVQAPHRSYLFGLAPPPKAPEVPNRKATLYNDPWFMSSKTRHPDAAWAFIKFAVSPEALGKYSEFTGMPPARRSSFVKSYELSFNKQLDLPPAVLLGSFMDSVNHGEYLHKAVHTGVEPFLNPLLDRILRREVAAQTGLEEAHRQLTRFLAEQQALSD